MLVLLYCHCDSVAIVTRRLIFFLKRAYSSQTIVDERSRRSLCAVDELLTQVAKTHDRVGLPPACASDGRPRYVIYERDSETRWRKGRVKLGLVRDTCPE